MRIDTSTISGFDAMSAEQKLAAVLGLDIPEPDMTGWVKKETFDAKATEAANLTKQLRSRMSEEEAAKAAEAAKMQELEEKYNALLAKSRLADYKAKYLAQGYDDKLAEDTAKALLDGDMDKVFANGEKNRVELEKKIKADVLRETPKPNTENGGKPKTLQEISEIKDYAERQAAIAANIELYGYKER